MVRLMTPQACPQALNLFQSDHHLAVLSAFAGESVAQLYVDDVGDTQAPRAALLVVGDHRFHLAGNPDGDAFLPSLAALLRERYATWAVDGTPFHCAYTPAAWEGGLREVFGDNGAQPVLRQYFELHLHDPVRVPQPPPGFRLRPIDETVVAESALTNHGWLIEEIHSEAASVADFLQHRFGYCLQHGDELVAWCLSEYNHLPRCELGIETMRAFRRRGLATIVALATIAHAQSAGITSVGWDCWQSNVASSSLALALGFAHVTDCPTWLCRLQRTDAASGAAVAPSQS